MCAGASRKEDTKEGEKALNEIAAWGKEHTLLLLLIFATAVVCGWLQLVRRRLKMPRLAALPIAAAHTLIGVFSVSAFAFLETGFQPESLGNMSLFGGVFFMPIVYWAGAKLFKRDMAEVFDIFTICMVFTLMCARVNCIFSGCCFGTLIPGMGGLRWPTRELEIVFYVALLIVLGQKILSGKTCGEIYPLYMISYGVFRFVEEFFRFTEHPAVVFHMAHLWAVITFGLGLSIYSEMQSRKKKVRR